MTENETKKVSVDEGGPTSDPWDDVANAGDLANDTHLKILISGPSGSGKSTLASMFERPLIGLTEVQGLASIEEANPNAIVYRDKTGRVGIRTTEDIARFRRMVRDPRLREKCDAVVLDSLTDVQTILVDHFTKRQGERAGKDKTSQESWGLIIKGTARLARELRDVDSHVVIICLDKEIEADGQMIHRPAVSGKRLPNDLAQYFNLVGYTSRQEVANGFRHEVAFRTGHRFLTKAMRCLDDIEPPEPRYWMHKRFTPDDELDPAVAKRVAEWRAMDEEDEDE